MCSTGAPYSMMDAEHPQNKITIVGNPSLGEGHEPVPVLVGKMEILVSIGVLTDIIKGIFLNDP